MEWKGGKLRSAEIRGLKGGAIQVRYGQKTATIKVKPGVTTRLNTDLAVE